MIKKKKINKIIIITRIKKDFNKNICINNNFIDNRNTQKLLLTPSSNSILINNNK